MAEKRKRIPARRLRTLQHQALPAQTLYGIDTEFWFRQLLADLTVRHGEAGDPPTKDQLHDEAVEWFLDLHAERAPEQYPARRNSDRDVTFWVDAKLIERVRALAARDGVKPARVLDAALSSYVKQRVSADLLAFRHRIQEEARRVYDAHSPRTLKRTRRHRSSSAVRTAHA